MEISPLNFALQIASETGKKLLENFGKTPPLTRGTPKEVKSFFDMLADTMIKEAIEKTFPDHSYLTEETGLIDKNSQYLWIIDPLDGTGNFVNSNPFFAISIALWKNGEPVLGVIEAPVLRERYMCEAGKGAYKINTISDEKTKTSVSETAELSKAYITFCEGGEGNRKRVLSTFNQFYTSVKDLRKLGSAALELAWVGLARADAYISHHISIWDIAAGILFVTEAGGKIFDFEGKPYEWKELLEKKEVDLLATNGKLSLKINE